LKDRFLVTISHELRTPVNAILGWTRLLEAQGWGRDGIERAAEAITRSAESQRRLIEDLLDVSRFESGRLRMDRVPLPLAPLVERAVEAVRPRAHEKGVVLETSITAEPITVLGDGHRLQQVVLNLLWNSIKFTPQSGIVRLSLARVDDQAELIVTDTGVGIPSASLPHIFEWFRQGDAGEHVVDAGLGVGLALVKQIVELHDGSVRATSEGLGTGATFVVRLPLVAGDAVATSSTDETGRNYTDPAGAPGTPN
jgi:signal transduction histidine kinase